MSIGHGLQFLAKAIVFAVTILIWSTVGFVAWVALLCRVMAVSSIYMTWAALSGRTVDHLSQSIERVAGLWPEGFDRIWRSVWRSSQTFRPRDELVPTGWKEFLFTLLFVLLFYIGIISSIRVILTG